MGQYLTDDDLDFADFDAIRRLIYAHSGIWLDDNKVTFLQLRMKSRLQVLNISSVREYRYLLKYDPQGKDELNQLIDVITINETWFFRELEPVESWRDAVLPGLMKGGNQVQLWSAGCSTGEEAYTLAILLNETYPNSAPGKFDILATDISQRALTTARTGIYDPYRLRHTSPQRLQKYFKSTANGQYAVLPEVQRLVRFGWINLADSTLPARMKPADIILCRNVLIYFDAESRRVAIANFFAALKPGGYLLLGHSESITLFAGPFKVERIGGKIVYQKPLSRAL